jgi:glutamyl-tRNA synthetase
MVAIPIPSGRPVRVRVAPSPTGDPHVGTAYIALFNMVFARKHGGQFILRIEDTDQVRSTRESEAAILRSLRWAGIRWDEGPDVGGSSGPYRQSERSAIYQGFARELVARGEAYYCFATPAELEEMRETARIEKRATAYDRRYRNLDPGEVERRLGASEPHVIRLKLPLDGETRFRDGLRGEIAIDNRQLDDQILLKSDGLPTYHLANVVDDHLMGITHVIRAEEWISSTPKHIRLYAGFGWEPPCFVHMPLLRNPDRSKISKRKNPVSLEYYEQIGILPEALLNFLGRMGFSMPEDAEKFTPEEMIQSFDLSRVTLTGPVFDLAKLRWLNGMYIRELSHEALAARLEGWRFNRDTLLKLAPLMRERIDTLDELIPKAGYFFGDDFTLDPAVLVPKGREPAELKAALEAATQALDAVVRWDLATLEATCRAQCEATGLKPKELFPAIRWAVTGRAATPPLFDTMEALGKARCQARLRAALEKL